MGHARSFTKIYYSNYTQQYNGFPCQWRLQPPSQIEITSDAIVPTSYMSRARAGEVAMVFPSFFFEEFTVTDLEGYTVTG